MRMVDQDGRELEVIQLDRGRGPIDCVRVSWRGYLIGPGSAQLDCGYYLTTAEALALVDVESLVEVIHLRPA